MKKALFLLALTFCTFILPLTSCDSGDTESTDGFPYVVYSNPSNNDIDVSPKIEIEIVFNNEMDETTVDNTSITITDVYGFDVPATVTCAAKIVTVTPTSILEENIKYTVTVASTLRDINGTTMGYTHEIKFYTLWGWGTPELLTSFSPIEDKAQAASSPQVAFDNSGNAIVVWVHSFVDESSTYSNVKANGYSPDSGWYGPVRLDQISGSAQDPQIAFDGSGNAIAVWVQYDGVRYNVWANRYTTASGWTGAVLIEDNNDGGAKEPQIAFDGSGNAVVVWYQHNGTLYNIWANRYTIASGWTGAELIDEDNDTDPQVPQIVMDDLGNAIVVWRQNNGTAYDLMANHYSTTSGWTSPTLIETDNTGNVFSPQIACDRSGNAIAVWYQLMPGAFHVFANRFTPASGWNGPELLQSDPTVSAGNPQIAMDNSGNAIVVWSQSTGTRANTCANRYTTASGWTGAELIETDDRGNISLPQIAFDAAGNAIAVWAQSDGARESIWANRYISESGWATAVLIETDNVSDAETPQIAFDNFGNAIVVWPQKDVSDTPNIWANRYTYSY